MRALEFNTIMNELLERPDIIKPVPLFAPDQVVYVKPTRRVQANTKHPQIGSPYETDLKILEVNRSKFATTHIYKLYSPSTGYVSIGEDELVSGQDKLQYMYKDYREATMGIDALPFFTLGEKVLVYNNNVHNLFGTSIVPLTKELNNHLTSI